MKAKDLKYPFTWEERKPVIFDRVFFVPDYYFDHDSFPRLDWSDREIFGNLLPVVVEFCSGNGSWIAEKALRNPECNWVAVEKKFERARKIWSKAKNYNISNLFVICGEAKTTAENYFAKGSISEIFINFPDPWPKKRHAKKRLITPYFVELLSCVLQKGGKATVVTDDEAYSERIIASFSSVCAFRSLHPPPFFVTELKGYGTSFFETLWKRLGKVIRYHQYICE